MEVIKIERSVPEELKKMIEDNSIETEQVILRIYDQTIEHLLKLMNFKDKKHMQDCGYDIVISQTGDITKISLVKYIKAVDLKINY